ncbi:GAF domain-containing protein [Sulfurimonas aquatica]|uniref:GAF domain-containing protein n=1 Tax=Sulfurimonas aquatica TaxID=2672570 RepID=A0A975GBY1_9BACT|nr:GAF domain-containing protein [Sulfurimonas aquatica]QSZ40689.1 GAF domain-containing protein [Sulfurimonas aquatica]
MKHAGTYHTLANFGRELLEKRTLAEGLPLIATYAKNVINADRCSIFMYDAVEKYFWTTLADGVEKIIISSDKGIVGYTLKTEKPVVANDAYAHPSFLPEVDKETGYKTENVITAPIFSSKREIIGILQLLNKPTDFDSDDVKFMVFFSHYVSGFLELTNIYLQEDRRLLKANEK